MGPFLSKVDPISRAEMNSELGYAAADRPAVSEMTVLNAVEALKDRGPPGKVLKAVKPIAEHVFSIDDKVTDLASSWLIAKHLECIL